MFYFFYFFKHINTKNLMGKAIKYPEMVQVDIPDIEMVKFPSIEAAKVSRQSILYRAWQIFQGQDELEWVENDTKGNPIFNKPFNKPILEFEGTIKLHGSNGGFIIRRAPDGGYYISIQSRKGILSLEKDNYNFFKFMSNVIRTTEFENFLELVENLSFEKEVQIFGEVAGKGIQSGMAINEVDKFFMVFNIKRDNICITKDEIKNIKLESERVFNIYDYKTFNVKIDFNDVNPAADIMEELTLQVEANCPVGEAFGHPNKLGEGIVWRCVTPTWGDSRYWFKTKGEKHQSQKTDKKRKTIQIDPEKVKNVQEFVEKVVTESRLEQGISELKENHELISKKQLGEFLAWVFQDIVKENSDIMLNSGLTKKDVGSAISKKAREWFFVNEDEF